MESSAAIPQALPGQKKARSPVKFRQQAKPPLPRQRPFANIYGIDMAVFRFTSRLIALCWASKRAISTLSSMIGFIGLRPWAQANAPTLNELRNDAESPSAA